MVCFLRSAAKMEPLRGGGDVCAIRLRGTLNQSSLISSVERSTRLKFGSSSGLRIKLTVIIGIASHGVVYEVGR
jgi:hypothetical protein